MLPKKVQGMMVSKSLTRAYRSILFYTASSACWTELRGLLCAAFFSGFSCIQVDQIIDVVDFPSTLEIFFIWIIKKYLEWVIKKCENDFLSLQPFCPTNVLSHKHFFSDHFMPTNILSPINFVYYKVCSSDAWQLVSLFSPPSLHWQIVASLDWP
jgi:hypothetical protein